MENQNPLSSVYSEFIAANEAILNGIVEQIEGRPAVAADGLNFTIAYNTTFEKKQVFYKNVLVGHVLVSIEKDRVITVFKPVNNEAI